MAGSRVDERGEAGVRMGDIPRLVEEGYVDARDSQGVSFVRPSVEPI